MKTGACVRGIGSPQVHLSPFHRFLGHEHGSQRCLMIDGGGSRLLNAGGD